MKWKTMVMALSMILAFQTYLFADISVSQRANIITEYNKILENREYTVGRTSDLPFTKELIRKAIVRELLKPTYKLLTHDMETAYLELETFVCEKEFEIIKRYEQDPVSKTTTPVITQGPSEYVEIQRKILDRQKRRLEELRRLKQNHVNTLESYYLPEIECRFNIPSDFKKADARTRTMVEKMRMSVCPKDMSPEEKRESARLEVVFLKQLNKLKLPLRPFFTIRIRDIGRPVTEYDFEKQIAIFEKMARDMENAFKNTDPIRIIDHVLTGTPLINYKNHSVIISHQETSSYGNAEGYYLIQYFFYYRSGLLTLTFYSDRYALKSDINDFKTIVYSMKFGERTRW
ncbi:MAG: hypothetical protein JRD02_04050 [Deltaproteobacteria bacterium]|nr:hypothetical protein [Deltaproteobacteria bacterium]